MSKMAGKAKPKTSKGTPQVKRRESHANVVKRRKSREKLLKKKKKSELLNRKCSMDIKN